MKCCGVCDLLPLPSSIFSKSMQAWARAEMTAGASSSQLIDAGVTDGGEDGGNADLDR